MLGMINRLSRLFHSPTPDSDYDDAIRQATKEVDDSPGLSLCRIPDHAAQGYLSDSCPECFPLDDEELTLVLRDEL